MNFIHPWLMLFLIAAACVATVHYWKQVQKVLERVPIPLTISLLLNVWSVWGTFTLTLTTAFGFVVGTVLTAIFIGFLAKLVMHIIALVVLCLPARRVRHNA